MNSLPTTFSVDASSDKQRLDQFLTSALAGHHSRSQITLFIKQGAVTVENAVTTKPSYPVSTGQTVGIVVPQPPLFPLTPHPVSFEIIAEEKDFLVINKPAGLVVHHATSAPDAVTLVHGLLHRYPEFSQFESNERPGIVHRLDKDTSGLILVARNPQALTALAALFKDRKIQKKYHAIVAGWPERTGTIDLPIGRHPIHRHTMSVNGTASRHATTHYQTLAYYQHAMALVEFTIVTGRTHQIRVHAAHQRFSILGDEVYGSGNLLIGRQALHAHFLSFEYKGTRYTYTAPYPSDFSAALEKLLPEPTDY
ncbi:MAG: rRNA synthase [Candidatus Dependentiae bacterium]|nr:rRNA synthase [Candidatus Dependentiae bacterium]